MFTFIYSEDNKFHDYRLNSIKNDLNPVVNSDYHFNFTLY